jgi:hypothetical protein
MKRDVPCFGGFLSFGIQIKVAAVLRDSLGAFSLDIDQCPEKEQNV